MAGREFTKEIRGFAGLNTQSPNNLIADNELQECTNYVIGLRGELRKRPGLERLNNSAFTAPISLLGAFVNPTTVELRLFGNQAGSSTNKYSTDGVTWTALGTTKSNIVWAATLGAKLFFGNDSSGVHEYNWGTNTLTALTSSPNGNEGIVFKQRLFVVITGATPLFSGRIQFSEPYGAATGGGFTGAAAWPSTNTIDIESESEGDFIVTLFPINDVLYVFKRNSIWSIYVQGSSPADWIVRKVVSNLGCVYKKGVAQFNNVVYFRGQNGMYRTDGVSFQEISSSIRDSVRLPAGVFAGMPVNTGNQGPVRYKDYILFPTFDSGTYVRTIWCFNYKNETWTKWDPYPLPTDAFYSVVGVERGSASLIPGVYFGFGGGNTSNRFILAIREGSEVYQDNATNYSAQFKTKDFDFGHADLFKRVDWIAADVYSQKVIFRYVADDTMSSDSSVSTDTLVPRRVIKKPGVGLCRRIHTFLEDDGETFEGRIHSITIKGSIGAEVSKVSTL